MSIAFLKYSGGYNVGDPPLPIPNREVKPNGADGTASQWESRTPPFLRRERGGGIGSHPPPRKKGEGESLESEALSFFILSLQKSFYLRPLQNKEVEGRGVLRKKERVKGVAVRSESSCKSPL